MASSEREDEEKERRLRQKLLEKRAQQQKQKEEEINVKLDEDEPLSIQPREQQVRKDKHSHSTKKIIEIRQDPNKHVSDRRRRKQDGRKVAVECGRGEDPTNDPKVQEGWMRWKVGLTDKDKEEPQKKEKSRDRGNNQLARHRAKGQHRSTKVVDRKSPVRYPKQQPTDASVSNQIKPSPLLILDKDKERQSRRSEQQPSTVIDSSSGWLKKTISSRELTHNKSELKKGEKKRDVIFLVGGDVQEQKEQHREGVDLTPTQDEAVPLDGQKRTSSTKSSPSPSPSPQQMSKHQKYKRKKETKVERGKYSKFESSPDTWDEEEGIDQVMDDVSASDEGENEEGEINSEGEDDTAKVDVAKKMEVEETADEIEVQKEEEQEQLPVYYPGISGCRSVDEFHCLNKIEEGTFGVVYRAKEKRTDEVVALKRLKMEKEKEGFPITSLREINMLLKAGNHLNVVNVREIVIGTNMDKIYLVMEYVEHDMKCLMEGLFSRGKHFTIGQVKTLTQQLLSGVNHLHELWILHRDLKTSNLLLSHRGILKIGDFGLAREYGEPLKPYTPIVVTLWYRAPELLLGIKEYSTAIDLWSVGCILAEFLTLKPLFPGRGEMDEINRIFKTLGTPSDTIWPDYSELPGPKKYTFGLFPYNQLRKQFGATVISDVGFKLLNRFLTYNPEKRINAREALKHDWFTEEPLPVKPEMFPTWPAKSEGGRHPPREPSPQAPLHRPQKPLTSDEVKIYEGLNVRPQQATGFSLRSSRIFGRRMNDEYDDTRAESNFDRSCQQRQTTDRSGDSARIGLFVSLEKRIVSVQRALADSFRPANKA